MKPKLKKLLLPFILVLLIAATIINSLLLVYLLHDKQTKDNIRLGQMIIQAIDNLHQPLPVDAASGKVFIHDAGLSLEPVPESLGRVEYFYSSEMNEVGGAHSAINLARTADIRMAEGPMINPDRDSTTMFERVPKLQACSRGITMQYQKMGDAAPAATKVLANGKTLYIYTEPLCPNADLLEYAKTIQSY